MTTKGKFPPTDDRDFDQWARTVSPAVIYDTRREQRLIAATLARIDQPRLDRSRGVIPKALDWVSSTMWLRPVYGALLVAALVSGVVIGPFESRAQYGLGDLVSLWLPISIESVKS
jgi:hypothetical protein